VDIAAMRDSLAEHGSIRASLNPSCTWMRSVDHSLAVEVHARDDAAP
jgi:aconitate hydratase